MSEGLKPPGIAGVESGMRVDVRGSGDRGSVIAKETDGKGVEHLMSGKRRSDGCLVLKLAVGTPGQEIVLPTSEDASFFLAAAGAIIGELGKQEGK